MGDQKNLSATLGDDDYEDRYINKLIINNSADTTEEESGVYFNQNVFVKDLEFSKWFEKKLWYHSSFKRR